MDRHEFKGKSLFVLIILLLNQISIRRRIHLFILFLLMLISSFAEIFSLTLVIPFLTIISNPEKIWEFQIIENLKEIFRLVSPEDLILPITAIFIVSSIFSAVLRLSTFWLNGKLAALIGSDVGYKAYYKTLHQPYENYISSNSSNLISALKIHLNNVVSIFNLFLTFISSLIILFGLVTTLLIFDGKVSIFSGSILGLIYIFIGFSSNKKLLKNSRKIAFYQNESTKIIQEGLGAYRDIILDKSQNLYLDIFWKSEFPLRNLNAQSNFLGAFPKFMMEAFGISLIACVALILTSSNGNINEGIPLLGAFALGAQKILPATQTAYGSWAGIKANRASIEAILFYLGESKSIKTVFYKSSKLNFQKNIIFQDVKFSYNKDDKLVLKDISFEIKKGERVAIIGKTGSGKSTIIDLIMGLLTPCSGSILIDGNLLDHNSNKEMVLQWQSNIAHVPQSIYLADRSIAENIAFKDSREKIDINRVKIAAEKAQIAHFIESIPEKYSTFVGERGIKLSGGQRQRIGIARALYKGASILILDEATSALDDVTERNLMKTIDKLDKNLTIIMIAHRLTTIKNCKKLIKINNGLIESIGNPNKVL